MVEHDPIIPEGLIWIMRAASRIAVLTGAGISAESSVPTFRDAQTGLWSQYRPEELATTEAFRQNPTLVWKWYQWRRELVNEARPNLGHTSLVIMEKRVPEFCIITQNVDELHQNAGSKNVIELHGSIHRFKCFRDGTLIDALPIKDQVPPRCPDCDDYIRPDVVWFGESLPDSELQRAWEAAQNCEVFLSIGTSAIVQPAASLPYIAADNGASVVEINLGETPLSPKANFTIIGPSGEVLPKLIESVWPDVEK